VLRQPLPAGTVGGGRVLDAQPLTSGKRADAGKWLEMVAHATTSQQIALRVERRGTEAIGIAALAREMGFKLDAVREIATDLVAKGELVMVSGEIVVSPAAFSGAIESVLSRLRSAGPAGLKRSVVQSQSGLGGDVLSAVLARIVDDGKAHINDEIVAIRGAAPVVSAKESQKLQVVAAAYRSAGLAAPSVREAAQQLRMSDAEIRRIVTLLIREKTLVRMGSDDAFVHADALRELNAKLGAMRGKTIDVAGFKALTGLTRKHAIPLLEYLDRERITRKQGDARIVL
jgi:selenocysteine-specific elongation factor